MTESGKPRWRTVVDGIDQRVTPAATQLVRSNLFADVVAASTRLEVQVRRRLQRQYGAVWGALNLPTAAEQRGLHAQVAALEARVRDLTERLEEAGEAPDTGAAGR